MDRTCSIESLEAYLRTAENDNRKHNTCTIYAGIQINMLHKLTSRRHYCRTTRERTQVLKPQVAPMGFEHRTSWSSVLRSNHSYCVRGNPLTKQAERGNEVCAIGDDKPGMCEWFLPRRDVVGT